jgi:hypothetical protein
MSAKNNLILCSALVAALAGSVGCASRKVPVSTPIPSIRREYVDLRAGWRIRFVAPVLKHGQSAFHLQTAERHGDVITFKTPKDFIGYEVALYSVKARHGGGVAIRFKSAEIRSPKKVTKRDRPPVPLFHLPARMRYVRLVFLTKVSAHDHNQGILAATSMRQLNALTRRVEASPDKYCKRSAEVLCSWVPRGMTAQPEKRYPEHHGRWVPVL